MNVYDIKMGKVWSKEYIGSGGLNVRKKLYNNSLFMEYVIHIWTNAYTFSNCYYNWSIMCWMLGYYISFDAADWQVHVKIVLTIKLNVYTEHETYFQSCLLILFQ